MKRQLIALLASVAVMLAWGAGTAAAEDATPVQLADQAAQSGQAAGAGSGATQSGPSNQNVSVRVLSPGDDGDVTQSNTVSSGASATNLNATGQSASQTQSGSGIQVAGQHASNEQLAAALSAASQSGASNTNTPVRVLSPGNGGDVVQSNTVQSDAKAANANLVVQDADQTQAGGGACPCPTTGGIQTSDQSASNGQVAAATSAAEQKDPENTNISVRVLSPGNDGKVTQSNAVSSSAHATNLNATGQDVDQTQAGSGNPCCPSGPSVQTADQKAHSEQQAAALSAAKQEGAKNTNVAVRVHSPGHSGDVSQSNTVASSAAAGNLNVTDQDADQTQAGGSGSGIQTSKQWASNGQAALAGSLAIQSGASNANIPVRVGSPGNDGSVAQSNTVSSTATAANLNATKQDADQSQAGGSQHVCCPSGPAIQTVEQNASNRQAALAESAAVQAQGGKKDECGCPSGGNTNAPVRVHSPGGGGHVSQSNHVASLATAVNVNATEQDADQRQAGAPTGACCPSGPSIQVLHQNAESAQAALAASTAVQLGASNANGPVRVASPGDDGRVAQTNSVLSAAAAGNGNLTRQEASQTQATAGIGIQALGQKAASHQLAGAVSAALQLGASNRNEPVRVHSPGGGGSVAQSNSVASGALAVNLNATTQAAWQTQAGGGGACCPGTSVQALGQLALNAQGAAARSLALQAGGRDRCGCPTGGNANAPVRVDSAGGGGHVAQANAVASAASAANVGTTLQAAAQQQAGQGLAIQALGQAAGNLQAGTAASLAAQLGAHGRRSR